MVRPCWHEYYKDVQAIIFVVDSADVDRMSGSDGSAHSELRRLLADEGLRDAVLLVLANKLDLPNSMQVQEITKRLELEKVSRKWSIQGASAATGDGLYEALDWLSNAVRSAYNIGRSKMMLSMHSGRNTRAAPEHKPSSNQHAVVIGGSGAIGACLVAQLAADPTYAKITCINRREWSLPAMSVGQEKLHHVTCDITREEELAGAVRSAGAVDAAFCTLGTTRRDAGSAEAFRAIDLHATVAFAKACKHSAQRFHLVTSQGANANSWFLYMQTKGEAEQAIQALDFPSCFIYRPGLLDRGASKRFVEKVGKFFAPAMPVATVARAMVACDKRGSCGASGCRVTVLSNTHIYDAALSVGD